VRTFKFKPKIQMSKQQLLGLISALYAEKIVQDEVDDREGNGRLSLRQFLHMYFLDQKGSAAAADRAMVTTVVNVLAHLRGQFSTAVDDEDEPEAVTQAKLASLYVFTARSPRVVLFARFLGLRHEGLEPVPLQGLSIFLATLARAQKGTSPLLPVSGERVLISTDHFVQTLDWVFRQSRAVTREAIKVDLTTSMSEHERIDLDFALEYTLDNWRESVSKLDARLEALFSTVSAFGNFDFETFNEVRMLCNLVLAMRYVNVGFVFGCTELEILHKFGFQ
jgi:hypothetical protein